MAQPTTYTLQLKGVGVHPCAGNEPQPGDINAAVGLYYTATIVAPGNPPAGESEMAVFQSARQTADIDLSGGTWKEVENGSAHGVLWSGESYTDASGKDWERSVKVLVVERGDVVFVIVGQSGEEVFTTILTQLGKQPPLRLMQRGGSKVRD